MLVLVGLNQRQGKGTWFISGGGQASSAATAADQNKIMSAQSSSHKWAASSLEPPLLQALQNAEGAMPTCHQQLAPPFPLRGSPVQQHWVRVAYDH